MHGDALRTFFARVLSCALLVFSFQAFTATLSLSVADIVSPDFSARDISFELTEGAAAELRIAELHLGARKLRGVRLRCAQFDLSSAGLACRDGSLAQLPGLRVEFDYRFGGAWKVAARLRATPGKALGEWLPAGLPSLTQGRLDGSLRAGGDASGANALHADLRLSGVAFSDAAGLHAAEGLGGTLKLDAARKGARWDWQGALDWRAGEVFWEPLYLAGGGRKLTASGSFDDRRFELKQAQADLADIGRVQLSALWDRERAALHSAALRGENLALQGLFADYARPFLEKGALAESTLYGHADLDWNYRDGATQALHLALREAGIADAERRFALLGVTTDLDWRAGETRIADITFAGGTLLGAPLGAGRWQVRMQNREFSVAQAALPVFDGSLELRDFRLAQADGQWCWRFGAALKHISMEQFSRAAGWPEMAGALSGDIPSVSYADGEVRTEGALRFELFGGRAEATQLRLADPFGRAPRLYGNLVMRDLDLGVLTRTFSFGNMQGRIDVDVNSLELQDWRPARFDARIASSTGSYPKRISQKAVQNISALGGAGAAAAIQRSYLRFFETFGYDRIEWRCVLRNGVCAMGGIGDGGGGAYTIVKGGGIPAITVMGYNRAVSWDELLARIKRVTEGNMQAVVR